MADSKEKTAEPEIAIKDNPNRPTGLWMSEDCYPISVGEYFPEEGDDIWPAYTNRLRVLRDGIFKYDEYWFLVDEGELFIIPEYVYPNMTSIRQFVEDIDKWYSNGRADGINIGARQEREHIRHYAAIINGLPAPEGEDIPF